MSIPNNTYRMTTVPSSRGTKWTKIAEVAKVASSNS